MIAAEHVILDGENPGVGNQITAAQAAAMVNLDWIEWVDSTAGGEQQFYNRTEASKLHGDFVSDLVFALEQDFADFLEAAERDVKVEQGITVADAMHALDAFYATTDVVGDGKEIELLRNLYKAI